MKTFLIFLTLTQGIKRGHVLPHVVRLLRTRLPNQSVHVVAETETGHVGGVHGHSEQVLMAAQTDLHRGTRQTCGGGGKKKSRKTFKNPMFFIALLSLIKLINSKSTSIDSL